MSATSESPPDDDENEDENEDEEVSSQPAGDDVVQVLDDIIARVVQQVDAKTSAADCSAAERSAVESLSMLPTGSREQVEVTDDGVGGSGAGGGAPPVAPAAPLSAACEPAPVEPVVSFSYFGRWRAPQVARDAVTAAVWTTPRCITPHTPRLERCARVSARRLCAVLHSALSQALSPRLLCSLSAPPVLSCSVAHERRAGAALHCPTPPPMSFAVRGACGLQARRPQAHRVCVPARAPPTCPPPALQQQTCVWPVR